jgi:hypothetical protein
MVAECRRGEERAFGTPHQLMLRVGDVDAALETARTVAAEAAEVSRDWEYGETAGWIY